MRWVGASHRIATSDREEANEHVNFRNLVVFFSRTSTFTTLTSSPLPLPLSVLGFFFLTNVLFFLGFSFFHGFPMTPKFYKVPGGWAAQKIGGRQVLLLSFVLWSSTCFLVPLDPNRVTILVVARLLVGVAQGFIFPSIHTVLAQWVPPHERSRSVSLTTSGMYLGAAMGMLVLPSLVKFRGPQSVFIAEAALGVIWSFFWFKYATDPPRSEHQKATATGFGESLLPTKASQKIKVENGGTTARTSEIPWKRILASRPVWAIVDL